MSRFSLVSLAALFIALPAARAHAADPAAIRSAVRLPSMQLQAGVGYSPRAGLVEVDEAGTPEAAIARVRTRLKGGAGDAAAYRTLGSIYEGQGKHSESRQAYAKAVELYEQALKQQPDDAALIAGKGDALAGKGELTSAESFLKAETKRLPNSWQVRTALGRILRQRAYWSFWPGKEERHRDLLVLMNQQGPDFPVLAAVRLKSQYPTEAALKTADALVGEAHAAFEVAVMAAAGSPEPYAERMANRFGAVPLSQAIEKLQKMGSKASILELEDAMREVAQSSQSAMLNADTLTDARKVAELRGNDPQAWGFAAAMARLVTGFLAEATKGASPAVRKALYEPYSALDGLAEKAKAELSRIARSANPQEAAGALEALGLTQYQEQEMAASEASLRKAVSLDPGRTQSWELLAGLLLSQEKHEEIAALYEGSLKHRDTPRARLVLAKVYERLEKPEKVEAHLTAALKLDESDVATRIYNAAFVLRRRGTEGVPAAEQHLAEAEKLMERRQNKSEALNIKYVRAAIHAVQSRTEAARKGLAEVLKEDEGHSAAVALNKALMR